MTLSQKLPRWYVALPQFGLGRARLLLQTGQSLVVFRRRQEKQSNVRNRLVMRAVWWMPGSITAREFQFDGFDADCNHVLRRKIRLHSSPAQAAVRLWGRPNSAPPDTSKGSRRSSARLNALGAASAVALHIDDLLHWHGIETCHETLWFWPNQTSDEISRLLKGRRVSRHVRQSRVRVGVPAPKDTCSAVLL